MKPTLLLILLGFFIFNLKSQTNEVIDLSCNYCYTYTDNEGRDITPENFDYSSSALPYSNNLLALRFDGKWGYINKQGKIVIEFATLKLLEFTKI